MKNYDNEKRQLNKKQQKFYKDSKITNCYDELIVCYHYSDEIFDSFDPKTIQSGCFGAGFYFFPYRDTFCTYGEHEYKCYLNIKNPFLYEAYKKSELEQILKKAKCKYDKERLDELLANEENMEYHETDLIDDILNHGVLKDESGYRILTKILKKSGYDGIWVGDEAVAFYPNQIKLTTNKNPSDCDKIDK